jgi:hypothetical protein
MEHPLRALHMLWSLMSAHVAAPMQVWEQSSQAHLAVLTFLRHKSRVLNGPHCLEASLPAHLSPAHTHVLHDLTHSFSFNLPHVLSFLFSVFLSFFFLSSFFVSFLSSVFLLELLLPARQLLAQSDHEHEGDLAVHASRVFKGSHTLDGTTLSHLSFTQAHVLQLDAHSVNINFEQASCFWFLGAGVEVDFRLDFWSFALSSRFAFGPAVGLAVG